MTKRLDSCDGAGIVRVPLTRRFGVVAMLLAGGFSALVIGFSLFEHRGFLGLLWLASLIGYSVGLVVHWTAVLIVTDLLANARIGAAERRTALEQDPNLGL